MTLRHYQMLLEFHRKCAYRYTYPVAWVERLEMIKNAIRQYETVLTK